MRCGGVVGIFLLREARTDSLSLEIKLLADGVRWTAEFAVGGLLELVETRRRRYSGEMEVCRVVETIICCKRVPNAV